MSVKFLLKLEEVDTLKFKNLDTLKIEGSGKKITIKLTAKNIRELLEGLRASGYIRDGDLL